MAEHRVRHRVKAVFFVLALSGLATMWIAVFADKGAAPVVVANRLRLRKGTPASRAQHAA
jgi:Cd2+/Zn2+-exporting ATPase